MRSQIRLVANFDNDRLEPGQLRYQVLMDGEVIVDEQPYAQAKKFLDAVELFKPTLEVAVQWAEEFPPQPVAPLPEIGLHAYYRGHPYIPSVDGQQNPHRITPEQVGVAGLTGNALAFFNFRRACRMDHGLRR